MQQLGKPVEQTPNGWPTSDHKGFEGIDKRRPPLRVVEDFLVVGEIPTDQLDQKVRAKALIFVTSAASPVQNRQCDQIRDARRIGVDEMFQQLQETVDGVRPPVLPDAPQDRRKFAKEELGRRPGSWEGAGRPGWRSEMPQS